jgi:protein-disulfide isomerase
MTNKSQPSASAKSSKQRREALVKRQRQQQTTLIRILAVAFFAVVVIVILVQNQQVEAFVPADAGQFMADVPAEYQGTTEQGFYFIGNPNAKVTIEEFSSFSCPHCKTFHDNYFKGILDKIKAGDVKFVYIPLTRFGGFISDGMSKAALCAGEQGKFWQMHEVMFDWQGRYASGSNNTQRLTQAATALGLDAGAFGQCLGSTKTNDLIALAEKLQAERNVTGTPAVFLNGTKLIPETADGRQGPSLTELRGIIESTVAQ